MAYHGRWEEELTFDQIKSHLGGRPPALRSQAPAGAVQGVYGLLLAHYVVRRVMHGAAVTASVDPARLSLSNALRVPQCPLPGSPREAVAVWYGEPLRGLRRQARRPRRARRHPRVTKQKMSNCEKKRPQHRRLPQPTKLSQEALVMLI